MPQSDCSCSPLPTESCFPPSSPSPDCGQIRMFFGYTPKKTSSSIEPGRLQDLYYTKPIDADYFNKGFVIDNFKATPLFDSKILPNDITFRLTEIELLSTGSFEGWCVYCADYICGMSSPNNTSIIGDGDAPFGLKCMAEIGIDTNQYKIAALKMWNNLKNGDIGSLYSSIFGIIGPKPRVNTNKSSTATFCDQVIDDIRLEKLRVCYEWLKNIYDNYYGKQFLVKINNNLDYTQNICIKDEQGNSIDSSKYPMYIDGDGSSQGYYTSDEIVDGGFPKKNSGSLLGLSNANSLDWIQNTDGKISAFVKIGIISMTNTECGNILQDRYIYRKFKDAEGKCVEWTIDLSKLSPDNYYINFKNSAYTLYLKCTVENRFYLDEDNNSNKNTWVNITLAEKVPLVSSDINPMLALRDFHYLLSILPTAGTKSKKILNSLTNVIGVSLGTGGGVLGSVVSGALAVAKDGDNTNDDKAYAFGTRSSISQANIVRSNAICLIPQGVVIPFKSNVYRYGPYFHVSSPDEGGGVDILVEDNLAPWNFIKAGDIRFPDEYPYCAMDKFGKELSKFVNKGLQKLEKGRATVVGFPCYNIGDSVDTTSYGTFEIGPTLLTDISIDYGSGGFNTTYNFSTYSPRLGKSEKYLKDSWQQSIEDAQHINSYLRSEREKVSNIKKDYTKKLLEKDIYFTPLAKHKESTPNKLIFSGYYFSDRQKDVKVIDPIPTYTLPSESIPPDSSCSPSPSESPPSVSMSIPTSPSVESGLRRYTFAETDKGYSIQHIQDTYYQLAGMSLDGFYLPVSLRGVCADPTIPENGTGWTNHARLPRFSMRCKYDSSSISFMEWDDDSELDIGSDPGYPISSKTRDEIPPFKLVNTTASSSDCYLLPINQKYLNPYTTNAILNDWGSRKNDSTSGFVISSIVFGQEHTNFQITHTNEQDAVSIREDETDTLNSGNTDEYYRQLYKNFRIPSLRGPLVLQGWGYDTSGKPIPNSSDNYINAEYGQFRKDQLTDKFLKNWLENPKSWPVGPIDLRFDRERGVWTCPSPNKIIAVRLKEKLSKGGKAKAQLINPSADNIRFYEKYHVSGPDGENIKLHMDNTEVIVYDFIGESLPACATAYVYYDDNRYIVLNSPSQSTTDIIRFKALQICKASGVQVDSAYNESWGSYAGYSDKLIDYSIYGVRMNCSGIIVDQNGNPASESINKQFFIDNAANWLVILSDTAGKFGPSFALLDDDDVNEWQTHAATGFGARIDNENICLKLSADTCGMPSGVHNSLPVYDILMMESYARFLHGILAQDLYPTGSYPGDPYKTSHPSGNASVKPDSIIFYGDSPNGKLPIFKNSNLENIPIRVFDPWLIDDAPLGSYQPQNGPFFDAKEDTPFTAVFNEKEKKYYLWQVQPSKGTICAPTGDLIWKLDGINLKSLPNWNKNTMQVLTHNSGCLEWLSTVACEASPEPSPS
jgi:hypothetical protein